MKAALGERRISGGQRVWQRTRVRDIVLDGGLHASEEFLERVIADQPELLGFGTEEDESRVHGPFVPFRQVGLNAFNGRVLAPDILVLCGSGDVLVVEVELGDNAELKDRQVVAQVLEYAACLASCTEADLVTMFAGAGSPAKSWEELVTRAFPKSVEPSRLARQLLSSIRSRALHLVIACDDVPIGLRELVEAVVGQEALGEYAFRVVELAPFVSEPRDSVMFVPRTAIRTEIVSRMAVTVDVSAGRETPKVQVQVTPFADAEAAAKEATKRAATKAWDEVSFFDATADLPPSTREGLRTAFDHFSARGYKVSFGRGASLGTTRIWSGGHEIVQLCTDGTIWVYFNNVTDETAAAMRATLAGEGFDFPKGYYRCVKPQVWTPHLGELLRALDRCVVELPELRSSV